MSNFDIRRNLGDWTKPATDPVQLAWRILGRALEPGGLDHWAALDHEALQDSGLVVVYLSVGAGDRTRLLTEGTVLRVIDQVRCGVTLESRGADFATSGELVDAMASMSVKRMSVASAQQIVQVGLFGKVRYP